MNRETREAARQLRQNGKSVRDIAKALSVSRGSVSLWVQDIELTEEQRAELKKNQRQWARRQAGVQSNRTKFREKRTYYQQVGRERAKERKALHMMGCMLYWAKGAKAKKNSVHFVNSDPNMLLLFMRFLREELGVAEEWFRVQIHCHTHDPEEIRRIEQYWIDLLGLPESCLQKTQVKQGSDTRRNRLVNGVCALQVHRTEILHHIYGAIQEYGGFENPAWLF